LTLDVDYFRINDICENDNDTYASVTNIDESKIAVNCNNNKILIWDLQMNSNKNYELIPEQITFSKETSFIGDMFYNDKCLYVCSNLGI
jgi:hypothetical protein